MDEKQTTEAGHEAQGCFICQKARPFLRNLWTDATQRHFRNSRLEFLKGLRSLLDERIEHLAGQEQKGHHVTVE